LAQSDDEKAESCLEQGLDLGARELPGKDRPHMLRNVNGLAPIRLRQRQYDAAEILLKRALAGQELKLGRDHPYTVKTISDLGKARARS
jgi:hypothetical protein